jgi:hypothetical protein
MSIKINPRPGHLRTCSFVAKCPMIPGMYPVHKIGLKLRFPEGIPKHEDVCFFWLIENAPDERFPSAVPVSLRIYSRFSIPDDFIQPSMDEIKEFINLLSCSDSLYFLKNVQLIYPHLGEKTMQIDPQKINVIQFWIIENDSVKDSGIHAITGKDHIKYLALFFAKHGDQIEVGYDVKQQLDKPTKPDKLTTILEKLAEK